MYNLTEYSKNYLKTSDTLWNCYRDIPVDHKTNSEYFKYNTGITRKATNNEKTKKLNFLFHWSIFVIFKKTLDMPLINCEESLTLNWSRNCAISDEKTRDTDPNVDPPVL